MPVEKIIAFEEAVALVAKASGLSAKVTGTEMVSLLDTPGRVLATAILADRDQPPFDRATRDGFAVRAAGLPAGLRVVGEVKAGSAWVGEVPSGAAVAIMTGAPRPAGTDAVVMVEHVLRGGAGAGAGAGAGDGEGDGIVLAAGRTLVAGENVVARGSEARRGEGVIAAGTRVGAAEVAMAAACGHAEVSVWKRPRVAIVATGDELVEVCETPGAEQIRNSNSYALAAMVAAAGGEPVRLPIAPDTPEAVRASVVEGRQADLLGVLGWGLDGGIRPGGGSAGRGWRGVPVHGSEDAAWKACRIWAVAGARWAARVPVLRVAGQSCVDAGDVWVLCGAACACAGGRSGGARAILDAG